MQFFRKIKHSWIFNIMWYKGQILYRCVSTNLADVVRTVSWLLLMSVSGFMVMFLVSLLSVTWLSWMFWNIRFNKSGHKTPLPKHLVLIVLLVSVLHLPLLPVLHHADLVLLSTIKDLFTFKFTVNDSEHLFQYKNIEIWKLKYSSYREVPPRTCAFLFADH